MRRLLHILVLASTLLVGSFPGLAQERKRVLFEVHPPETEIRAFLPYSHPQEGDLLPNNSSLSVPHDVLHFPVRLSAPGYYPRELEVRLVEGTRTAGGEWRVQTRLMPDGLATILRDERILRPFRFYALLFGTLLSAGTAFFLVARKRGRIEAPPEVEDLQKRLDEVDPELLGRTLDSYRIEALLGSGNFADVYLADHTEYPEKVAVKVFRKAALDDSFRERVQREIAIGRELKHTNVIKIFAFGTFRDRPYMAMEYVDGPTLEQRLENGCLDLPQALDIARQLCRGLDYAHREGIIHRDIKPGNILLTGEGVAKLADFGVAKLLDTEKKLTQTGEALGTPHYMSPEQMKGRTHLTSDLYSLGAVLFEMVTGRTPYLGETAVEVITAHVFEEVPDAAALNPEVPPELASLISKLMAKKPQQRPQSALEVLEGLESFTRPD